MNYTEVRQMSLALSDQITGRHPCRKGKGRCCDYSTTISQDDADIIIKAYQAGNIPQAIISEAIVNSRKPGRNRCPFLSKNTKCTIYEYRPAICALTGTGATFSEKHRDVLDPLLERYNQFGENSEVPFDLLGSTMCRECHADLAKQHVTQSIEELIAHGQLLGYLNDTASLYISAWTRDVLSKVSKSRSAY